MKLIKNKDGWKRIRLDDVVIRREENDRENARARFDTFVKVEHMEAESLHLQGLGSQKDEELPPTFYKIFRKGQILFPTRNPHLRRTALAPCDGICGEKTLTLEVNEKAADPRLIPFLFHSASFYDHSAGAIIGSTNPHCRWRDIANYEFLLPPKDQQAKLAELLWAADAQHQAALELSSRVCRLYETQREALCFGEEMRRNSVWHRKLKREVPAEAKFTRLGEHLADIRYGTSKKGNSNGKGVQCVGIPHVLDENLNSDGAAFVELSAKEQDLIRLQAKDILIVRTNGNPSYTGRSALVPSDTDLVFASYLIRIRIDERDFDPEFLIRYLQTQTIRRFFKRHATSSAGNYNINTEDIKGVPVPSIAIPKQARFAEELSSLEKKRATAEGSATSSRLLLKSLVNQIF